MATIISAPSNGLIEYTVYTYATIISNENDGGLHPVCGISTNI